MNIVKKNINFLIIICFLNTIVMANNSIQQKQILNEFSIAYLTFNKKSLDNQEILPTDILIPVIKKAVKYALNENNNLNILYKCVEQVHIKGEHNYVFWIMSNELFSQINIQPILKDEKKQEIVLFLVKYQMQESMIQILHYFYSKKYYNENAKKILKDKLLRNDLKQAKCLFLLDAADMYSDPDVMNFLQKEASQCHEWGKNTKWVSLLLLAKHGDEKSKEKLIEIAKKACAKKNKRNNQIFYMPRELAIIPDERVTTLLRDLLSSKEEYMSSHHIYNLARIAEESLKTSLKGFPKDGKITLFIYPKQWLTEKELELYDNWLDNNKPYTYNSFSSFPDEIKEIILR